MNKIKKAIKIIRRDMLVLAKELFAFLRITVFHRYNIKSKLTRIAWGVSKYCAKNIQTPSITVLWAPGFNINEIFWVHDGLLASALRMRGVQIIPLICDGIQPMECSVYSGHWGKYYEAGYPAKRRELCENCRKSDWTMWKDIWKFEPIPLSKYITSKDMEECMEITYSLDGQKLKDYEVDTLPIGRMAITTVVNNHLVRDLNLCPQGKGAVRNEVYNGLILKRAFERVFEEVNPDRFVTHSNFHFPWHMFSRMVRQKGVSYFGYYFWRKGSWIYTKNKIPANLDVSDAWGTWKNRQLNDKQEHELNQYLLEIETENAKEFVVTPQKKYAAVNSNYERFLSFGSSGKPTALLAGNVVWDAAALGKDIFFPSMVDWTIETIKYFKEHPEYQLIIKAHPGEKSPYCRDTRQCLIDEVKIKTGENIPENVLFIDALTDISPYELYPICKLGLIYTSTVGMEMAMRGVPVIIIAQAHYRNKGFTLDPHTKDEYFKQVNDYLLINEPNSIKEERKRLARVYCYLLYCVFKINMGLNYHDPDFEKPLELKIKSYKELLPGRNKKLDYICDSIINDLPILSKDRWPPE